MLTQEELSKLSPLMRQYVSVKEQYPGVILMFRVGDFYEMFFDDAKVVSRELDLVLTGKECGLPERAPMCGVPYHAVDTYIARLIAKGYKVAVCEQTEDPATAKGLVKRDVLRVHTPGTAIESLSLDEGKNNYLACIYKAENGCGLAFADVSTGYLRASFAPSPAGARVIDELSQYDPSEIILNAPAAEDNEISAHINNRTEAFASVLDDEDFAPETVRATIENQFGRTLSDLGLDSPEAAAAVGAIIAYLADTQKQDRLLNITGIEIGSDGQFMSLSAATRRNLELTESVRREKKGSLLWVLDKTGSPMGKRLLRRWIEQPLLNVGAIAGRQNAVEELYADTALRTDLAESLKGLSDIERIMTRAVYGSVNAKELCSLRRAFDAVPDIMAALDGRNSRLLSDIRRRLDPLPDIRELIGSAFVDDPPMTVREGGMIRDGFNSELDELRSLVDGGKGRLAGIEEAEKQRTGIKKLRIGYNRVFGYYIEVTNSFKELVPDNYIRKQTLTNAERYITPELKELESKVLGASERSTSLEYEIFTSVRKKVADAQGRIRRTAGAVAELDVLCSLATAAVQNGYERPVVNDSDSVIIHEGRHAVVEKFSGNAPFVPNDCTLDCRDNRALIITGPNMAGKSTYMRQIALIVIMAQMGSFVPAKSAEIGIVDSVFTRIGASDDLSAGQSTFMTEMTEVSAILENATSRSLIILDEVGRGTSTYDGMSIARAVLEYIADKKRIGAKTLFATHYHELTELEDRIEGVKNYNITVKKRGGEIVFLRRIARGGAPASYGVEVAKLAGLPGSVIASARKILAELEAASGKERVVYSDLERSDAPQVSFTSGAQDDVLAEIRNLDINTLTPIEALSTLAEFRKKLE